VSHMTTNMFRFS